MKKYETPVMEVKELTVANKIAFTLDETDTDNETSWLKGWTSGINNGNNQCRIKFVIIPGT